MSVSVAHVTTRDHGDSPARVAGGDYMNVQDLGRTGAPPHWLWRSGKVAPSFTGSSTQESEPCASTSLQSGSSHSGMGVGDPAPTAFSMGKLTPLLVYCGVVGVQR